MVIKTSDKKRDDIFFKAISSVIDRDGLLIDFRGGWFNGTVVTSNHNTFGEIQKRRLAVAD